MSDRLFPNEPRSLPRFSVIRYVPDIIAGEFVNVGVMVRAHDDQRMVATLRDWTRARAFAGDTSTVEDFADHLLTCRESHLDWYPEHASGCAQMTPWQPSLEEPRTLLERLAKMYLKDGDDDDAG